MKDNYLLVVKKNSDAPYDYYEFSTLIELKEFAFKKVDEEYMFVKIYKYVAEY